MCSAVYISVMIVISDKVAGQLVKYVPVEAPQSQALAIIPCLLFALMVLTFLSLDILSIIKRNKFLAQPKKKRKKVNKKQS